MGATDVRDDDKTRNCRCGVLALIGMKRRIAYRPLLSHDYCHGGGFIYSMSGVGGDEGSSPRGSRATTTQ
jgi:hypothetical protein